VNHLHLNRPFRPQEDWLDHHAARPGHIASATRAAAIELIAYLAAGGLLYAICRMAF
jgi:hypothetical protein